MTVHFTRDSVCAGDDGGAPHGGTVRWHFSYFAQRDPEVVLDVLRRLRLHAE